MPSIVGPYDGRKARRKRCDGCVKRKIKCHGGIPCENCKRTNQLCGVTINPTRESVVFVLGARNKESEEKMTFPLHESICVTRTERYLPYFFTSFLPMNIFTNSNIPISGDLLAMAKSSPALKDAIDAVAALHSRRQDQMSFVGQGESGGSIDALRAYTRSLRCVQEKIATNTFMNDQSALWVTFFLGLFELMRDSTGKNWLSHFLDGTCTMLRLQNPETLSSPLPPNTQRRSFFLATRIFEISRSLIFSTRTFLSSPEWSAATAKLWSSEYAGLWHPKEALFDMLPHFSDLSIRTLDFCNAAAQLSPQERDSLAKRLGSEGLLLQFSLQQWFQDATAWSNPDQNNDMTTPPPPPPINQPNPDTESLIGLTYYHATSIYLSGTYDYHTHWTMADAPILPRRTIDWHVAEILRLSDKLLAHGVAGVLLFFPLRVAGARAKDGNAREAILGLLQVTARRGFVVAGAFSVDLLGLWGGR